MKAHELRINNYIEIGIYRDKKHVIGNIQGINFTDKTVLVSHKGIILMRLSELKPIPITNQRLLDLGFTKSKVSEWYHIEDFQIEIVVDEENNFIFCVVNGFVLRHLKYIHQLQNLHFELTQKELTFKTK